MQLDQSLIDFLYSIPHASMSIPLYHLSNEISEENLLYYLDLIGNAAAKIDLFETFNLDDFDFNHANDSSF